MALLNFTDTDPMTQQCVNECPPEWVEGPGDDTLECAKSDETVDVCTLKWNAVYDGSADRCSCLATDKYNLYPPE